jgi:hypothetical protein
MRNSRRILLDAVAELLLDTVLADNPPYLLALPFDNPDLILVTVAVELFSALAFVAMQDSSAK